MGDERQTVTESMGDILKAVERYYPGTIRSVNTTLTPTAEAQLAADRAVSPGYAELTSDIFKEYGPENARTEAEIENIANQAASERELSLAKGTGRELVSEADAAQRSLDPEAYKTREELSDAITKYLGASDPTLNEAENEAIRRGVGRTSFNPQSAIDTAGAAQQFGDKFREKTALFGDAISRVAAAVPAMQSGISGFEVATRRAVGSTGQDRTPQATTNAGNNTYDLANNFMNQAGQIQQTRMAKQKSAMDNVGQGMEMGGRFVGAIGAGIGCWVAREVFGQQDIRWILFKEYLQKDAPKWFYNLYMRFGERFAQWIANKPILKNVIRKLMLRRIY